MSDKDPLDVLKHNKDHLTKLAVRDQLSHEIAVAAYALFRRVDDVAKYPKEDLVRTTFGPSLPPAYTTIDAYNRLEHLLEQWERQVVNA